MKARSWVRTHLGRHGGGGQGKIRTKPSSRTQNWCGQQGPKRAIFVANLCTDIPGSSFNPACLSRILMRKAQGGSGQLDHDHCVFIDWKLGPEGRSLIE